MKSTVTVIQVLAGDIFQFVKDTGCYKRGNLLVVKEGSEGRTKDAALVPINAVAAFYSLQGLSDEINKGNLRYAGTLAQPDILILDPMEA